MKRVKPQKTVEVETRIHFILLWFFSCTVFGKAETPQAGLCWLWDIA